VNDFQQSTYGTTKIYFDVELDATSSSVAVPAMLASVQSLFQACQGSGNSPIGCNAGATSTLVTALQQYGLPITDAFYNDQYGPALQSSPPPPPLPPALIFEWVLPFAQFTPGDFNPNITQANLGDTICANSWGTGSWSTSSVRPSSYYTTNLKNQQLAGNYSLFAPTWGTLTANYEEDHLVPLSLGGHPTSVFNLWPQPRNNAAANYVNNAETKDLLEQKLQSLVCSNVTSLITAQNAIAANWTAAYFTYINVSSSAPPYWSVSSG
jgi:hypothetical protein